MEVNFSSYRDSINASLRQWPELSWLNRFLQTPTPANGDKTSVHVFELLDNHFVESGTDSTAASLSQVLEVNVQSSRLRIVLICHGNSWDVDRNIVDIVCSKYSVDPRFVAKHFDYPDIRFEKNCPQDLRSAVNKVNDHYSENKYIWELGGDVMFPLSVQLGSCFSFAYQMNCLSLAVCQKDDKETSSQASQNSSDSFLTLSTVLLFLRAPQSQLSETSRIFFHRPNAQVTRSTLFRTQTSNSLSREFIRVLSELEISENESRDRFIAETILPYLVNLAGCCYAQYLRNIAPNALRAVDPIRTDNELLINDIQQLTQPRREVEAFLVRFPENKFGVNCTLSRSKELCRILYELTEDSKDLLLLSRAENRANESSDLGELIQAQVDEAKEAKDTSVKLGNLSQLAYVFLPLQLATSVMGMNLKTFGTGTVELRTFLIIFAVLQARFNRVKQIRAIAQYSRRASFLFGWFCLFHEASLNHKVWSSGIEYDIGFFQGRSGRRRRRIGGSGWQRMRATVSTTLRSGQFFNFFPRYWQGVLNELFEIIDIPQWGRTDENIYVG